MNALNPLSASRRLLPLSLLLCVALLVPAPVAAAAEPAGYEYFHTYAETVAELDAAAAAYPAIAARFTLGTSYEGRAIPGIKISDNVASDEDEPEVLITAQTHARERISLEMALYLVDLLLSNYGTDQRITDIVDSREIWIVPMANPDGAEYDMSDGVFRLWRKNRQPIPNSNEIGVDLNRTFGYKWNCCGGASNNPASDYYRGPEKWFAPETRAYRDFVNSRVVDGKQQITMSLGLHAAGRLVLWPYSHTKADHPKTMKYDDWRAFRALGKELASLNGYRPMQGSDLYIVDGGGGDWAYHSNRIFAFGFELAKGKPRRQYPTLAQIEADEARNRPAFLHFLEMADCPYRSVGPELAAKHCS